MDLTRRSVTPAPSMFRIATGSTMSAFPRSGHKSDEQPLTSSSRSTSTSAGSRLAMRRSPQRLTICRAQILVFLSSITLERKGVSSQDVDHRRRLGQVLVAVGTSAAHLNAEWVRYEWDSFFNDVLSGVKPTGQVFVYVDGVVSRELPRSLRQSQMIAHGPGSLEMLGNFVANALGLEASGPAAASRAPCAGPRADDLAQKRASAAETRMESRARDLQRGEKIAAIMLVRELHLARLKEPISVESCTSWQSARLVGHASTPTGRRGRPLLKRGRQGSGIKLVREATALGLKEAKELVDSCELTLQTGLH